MPQDFDRLRMRQTLDSAFRTVTEEHTDRPLAVDGQVPIELDGVLYRNGPGRFERGGHRYGHWFDGDGHLVRLALRDGAVRYSNRFVRTAEFRAEETSGQILYRAFGGNRPGGLAPNFLRVRFKNAANTNVIWQGGRLLALWEGGPPHRLDPVTLETLGAEDFGGQLRTPFSPLERLLSPLMPFTAHPKIDPETGAMVAFGLMFGYPNRLLIYDVDGHGRMAPPRVVPLERLSFVHDLAVTRKWIAFLLPRVHFDALPALLGLTPPAAALRLNTDQPMHLLLLPREGGPPRLFPTKPGFVFHVAQSFDGDDDSLVIDVVRYGRYPPLSDVQNFLEDTDPDSLPRLERLIIDPRRGDVACRTLGLGQAELPRVAPTPFGEARRLMYSLTAPIDRELPILTSLQRLDTDTGARVVRDFGWDLPGEPIVVTGDDGRERWILTLVYRSTEDISELLILDAEDLRTVATARLPHAVPPGLHGCWVARRSGRSLPIDHDETCGHQGQSVDERPSASIHGRLGAPVG